MLMYIISQLAAIYICTLYTTPLCCILPYNALNTLLYYIAYCTALYTTILHCNALCTSHTCILYFCILHCNALCTSHTCILYFVHYTIVPYTALQYIVHCTEHYMLEYHQLYCKLQATNNLISLWKLIRSNQSRQFVQTLHPFSLSSCG